MTGHITDDAQPTRDSTIEECAKVLDDAAQDWNRIRDPGMANNARSYARKIRALAAQPPAAPVEDTPKRFLMQREPQSASVETATKSAEAAIYHYLALFDRCGGSTAVSPEAFASARQRMRDAIGAPPNLFPSTGLPTTGGATPERCSAETDHLLASKVNADRLHRSTAEASSADNVELSDLRRDVIELREWKAAIIGKCKASDGFDMLPWGGDKEGWGFIHYFIGHLETRALEAEAQVRAVPQSALDWKAEAARRFGPVPGGADENARLIAGYHYAFVEGAKSALALSRPDGKGS